MKEVELKARVSDINKVLSVLEQKGCVLSQPQRQEDRVYVSKTETHPPGFEPKLRLRLENRRHIFTYKRPVELKLNKLEYETELSDPAAMEQIIFELGFILSMEIKKARRKGKLGEVTVCLDEVDGLGSFLELELMDENGGAAVQARLFEILKDLGFTREDIVEVGYDILTLRKLKAG